MGSNYCFFKIIADVFPPWHRVHTHLDAAEQQTDRTIFLTYVIITCLFCLGSAGSDMCILVRVSFTAHQPNVPWVGLFRNPVKCQNIPPAEDHDGISVFTAPQVCWQIKWCFYFCWTLKRNSTAVCAEHHIILNLLLNPLAKQTMGWMCASE